jgi:glutamyl/glutaminyl-tRNA synthetase
MSENNEKVVVRFPPSPTGLFHVGNARTFLFNYLFAKQNNGKIVFRSEDTDKERSKEEYTQDIIENLKWLGIGSDFSTTIKQSERSDIYKKYLEKLISEGKAYLSKEEAIEEGQRTEVIRFKNPNKKITFNDLIRGDIEFDTTELKDFVIAKSLEEPVYHLAVVVDDFEMGVTHVIRGDDGISNTPRQILIQEAIGAQRPIYAHLPMMLAPDRTKLSKRKHGEKVSVSYYRNAGYLPEAMINFLAMIGWNSGTDQEIFGMEELIKTFDLKKVQKKGAIFNVEKLDWLNKEYILRSSKEERMSNLKIQISKTKFTGKEKSSEFWEKFLKIMLDRIHRWGEVREAIEAGEFDYLFEKPKLDANKICWKNQTQEGAKIVLEELANIFENETNFNSIKEKIVDLAEGKARPPSLRPPASPCEAWRAGSGVSGRGDVLWPLRYALSGREKSPDPMTLIDILEIPESKERVKGAIKMLLL